MHLIQTEGVDRLLRKEAQKALIWWEARGSRTITVCFKTKHTKHKNEHSAVLCPNQRHDW